MSGWMSYFTGRKDTREGARDAIVGLRQQLLMLEKKEEHLQKKIEDELRKARANATTNKRGEYECTEATGRSCVL
jgi:charged multivesicular body protein 4